MRVAVDLASAWGGLWFTVLIMAVAGCDNCAESVPCPHYEVQDLTVPASDAELTWTWGYDDDLRSAALGSEPAGEGGLSCTIEVTVLVPQGGFEVPVGRVEMGEDVDEVAQLDVACTALDPELGEVGLLLHSALLGDLRRLELGSHAAVQAPWLTYPGFDFPDSYCATTLEGQGVTVTVEEATGGAAPFPEVVTPDYERVIQVGLGYAEPVYGHNTMAYCTASASVVGAVTFRHAAEHYTSHPDATCTPRCQYGD